jgi:hypothetical protein
MNKKAVNVAWVVIALLAVALVGFMTYWGATTLAVVPAVAVTYEGEFDAVKFITETDESFYSDYVATAFREDTTLDLWTGNITMSNFTKSGQDIRADLYFEIDGSNGMESLDDIDIELVSTDYTTKNITISEAKLYNFKTGALVKDFSSEVGDSELSTSYNAPLSAGKYVLHIEFHSLYLAGNVSPANVYKATISGESDGDTTDLEADILIAQVV